jgi:NAD(P)-dependent dehydrogenase (short-subunit alcohol dehydrogenase family)
MAVESAVDKFEAIDVLVNNAGNFYAGFFEELSQRQMELQLATSLFGPMKVTRAVLPVMREPGFFRTALLTPTSTIWAENSIEDYAARIQNYARFG